MNKRERVEAALEGREVDRPPYGFWGHDFIREWSAIDLAAAMVEPAREFAYDYVKVNPRATYFDEAWGARHRPSGDAIRHPENDAWPLHEPEDLAEVRPVAPDAGAFGEQLEALRLLGREFAGEVPFVQTVFSPLSVVGRMANGREPVQRWMTQSPDALHAALAAVAETLAAYSQACLAAGAGGIFFATTEWATYDVLTDDLYDTFGRTYDLRVLEAVEGAPFNILHVCRPNNMLGRLFDYPVSAFNWAMHAPGNMSLADAKPRTDKTLMGGVDERHALLDGSPDAAREQVREALSQTGGVRFMLAPGCSISPQTPPENIRAAIEAVEQGT
ncbi:MAG: uroporphyrinogen decarboxylase family protein [Dehalococcoidia bacterium]